MSEKEKLYTLTFLERGDNILLGFKKRGFGKKRWNGFGGKIKEGESLKEAAIREIKEEIGVSVGVGDLQDRGELLFRFQNKPSTVLRVRLFKSDQFVGEPKESEEMRPKYFNKDNIPYGKMWDDDKFWLPLFIEGKTLKGEFLFDENEKVVKYEVEEINF